MHVTAKTVYSILAVVELAGSPKGEAVKVSKIAEKEKVYGSAVLGNNNRLSAKMWKW